MRTQRELCGPKRRHVDHGKQRTALPYRPTEHQPPHVIAPAIYARDHDLRHIRLASRQGFRLITHDRRFDPFIGQRVGEHCG